MKSRDVIVVGGGVNGMLSARELAAAGLRVTLLERDSCARQASWAGGGILTPLYPWRYDDAITRLDALAGQQWPGLAASLVEESGIDPQYRSHGVLHYRLEERERALKWARRHRRELIELDATQAAARFPHLATPLSPALWLPGRGSIRTPRLGSALRQCLLAHPAVELIEHCEVQRLLVDSDGVCGVETSTERFAAPRVVVAGGPWSGQLLAQLERRFPITPVRGQMLLFEAREALLESVVLRDDFYLIPRCDGRILAGSTFEQCGFDRSTTEAGYRLIHGQALSMLPALAEVPVTHHWAGLRPGSPGSVPLVGPLAGMEGLWLNAGHGGNGVVLAPATAALLSALMLGREAPVDPEPYNPGASR